MEEVADKGNLARAFERVAHNRGAPGPNRQTIDQVRKQLAIVLESLHTDLLAGTYRPGHIRRVWIPKASGGQRGLGIPDVLDRVVQQALHQVLSPKYEATFHPSSHGFRPGRSCHTAIAEAHTYVKSGCEGVVDIDLEKFFDTVSHHRLMSRLEARIGDRRILAVIRRLLRAKVVMPDGVVVNTEEGTPQGGPLSPLLSNIVLDELDQELSRRGHRFVRYADDGNVYVWSERAAERVKASLERFIESRLRLKVNRAKSAVARTGERHFLGFRISKRKLDVSARTDERLREKVRELTPRTWGRRRSVCITAINAYARGWVNFFGVCTYLGDLVRRTDAHLRRRLRAILLAQWKTRRTTVRRLRKLGVPDHLARHAMGRGGLWLGSQTKAVCAGLTNAFFEKQGLLSFAKLWRAKPSKLTVAEASA
jgi:group II intron reverse transcriptase/maturase